MENTTTSHTQADKLSFVNGDTIPHEAPWSINHGLLIGKECNGDDVVIASFHETPDPADANIIVAAPELLELCKEAREEETIGTVRVVHNVEENRLQLFFPGKPEEETRQKLKHGGFRWSPLAGAWQRHLNNSAVYSAKRILQF